MKTKSILRSLAVPLMAVGLLFTSLPAELPAGQILTVTAEAAATQKNVDFTTSPSMTVKKGKSKKVKLKKVKSKLTETYKVSVSDPKLVSVKQSGKRGQKIKVTAKTKLKDPGYAVVKVTKIWKKGKKVVKTQTNQIIVKVKGKGKMRITAKTKKWAENGRYGNGKAGTKVDQTFDKVVKTYADLSANNKALKEKNKAEEQKRKKDQEEKLNSMFSANYSNGMTFSSGSGKSMSGGYAGDKTKYNYSVSKNGASVGSSSGLTCNISHSGTSIGASASDAKGSTIGVSISDGTFNMAMNGDKSLTYTGTTNISSGSCEIDGRMPDGTTLSANIAVDGKGNVDAIGLAKLIDSFYASVSGS